MSECTGCQWRGIAKAHEARAEAAEAELRNSVTREFQMRKQIDTQADTIGWHEAGYVTNAEQLGAANLRAEAAEAELATFKMDWANTRRACHDAEQELAEVHVDRGLWEKGYDEQRARAVAAEEDRDWAKAQLVKHYEATAKHINEAEARLAAVIALCKPTTGIDDEGETYVRMPSFTAIRAAATGETL